VTEVLAPCAGTVLALADVPDPVFAAEMVGPGVAVDPVRAETTVVAPIGGKVLKALPHAFVVLGTDGTGVLVHLGIDTVRLEGEGFEVLVDEGATVAAGDPVVRWNPADVEAGGRSPVIPVCVMDGPKGAVTSPLAGASAATGDVLFTWSG
jgi:glucose-specific phosphotransferase system IIA component